MGESTNLNESIVIEQEESKTALQEFVMTQVPQEQMKRQLTEAEKLAMAVIVKQLKKAPGETVY